MRYRDLLEGKVVPVNFEKKGEHVPDPRYPFHSAKKNKDGSYTVLGSSDYKGFQHANESSHVLMKFDTKLGPVYHSYVRNDARDHFTGKSMVGDLHERDVDPKKVRFK